MKIAILTVEQKNTLDKQVLCPGMRFNPVQDANEDWIISQQEIDQCTIQQFMWVKDLELTDWAGRYVRKQ
jgi:hypothetical protein